MVVDDQARLSLLRKLNELLGPEDASTLMSLPPANWHDLATKADIADLQAATRADIADLQAATAADIADLQAATRADIGGLRSELKADIGGLRSELKADLGGLRSELKAEIGGLRSELRTELALRLEGTENRILSHVHRELTIQTRIYVLAIITTLVALSSVTVLTG